LKVNIRKDQERAKALRYLANRMISRLNSFNKNEFPECTIADYYQILHMLLEAITSENGIKFKGEGAHKEIIRYFNKILIKDDIRFLQQLREFRNRIFYEGFRIHSEYLIRNETKINKIIHALNI